jgi:hypothetical protein
MGENRQDDSVSRDYLDRLEESIGTNRDSHGLGTMPAGPFNVGSVDAFIRTPHEENGQYEYKLVGDESGASARRNGEARLSGVKSNKFHSNIAGGAFVQNQ